MKYEDGLSLIIWGFRLLNDYDISELLGIMKGVSEWLSPEKIGAYGANYQSVDENSLKEVWFQSKGHYERFRGISGGGSIDFKGKKPRSLYGDITWDHYGFNSIAIYISMKYIQTYIGYPKFLELVKQLFIWLNGYWGYSYHPSQSWVHYHSGINHEVCLGGITWLTLFGLPYVEMFGKEKLMSVPCRVEEFADNKFLLLTSDEPMEEMPDLLRLQESVRKHLGEDAFFRHEEEAKRPDTDLEGPSKEGYRAPDFAKYYNGKTPSSAMYDEPEGRQEIQISVGESMAKFAKHAVNFAKQGFKIKLDFSDNSIKDLEKILEVFYNGFTPERKPTEDELQNAAVIWGAYLGETLRRNYGGEWAVENEISVLNISGFKIFPSSKVYKRLTNGPEDNVAFYYDTFKAELAKASGKTL